jgi:DNA-binding NtrC family response regulator
VPVRKPKLLIVDDEPDMLDFVERALRRQFEVIRCACALAALERLESEEGFDILVTDHRMPGLSGLELLARITARHPNLVKVLLSGYAELAQVQRARDCGEIHGYVLKPVDSNGLLRAIHSAYVAASRQRETTPE